MKVVNSNKILITGASGFIGKHFLEYLSRYSYSIACVDVYYDDEFISKFKDRVHLFRGSILDPLFIEDCINNFSPDYVYHFAGSKSRTNSLPEFKHSNGINYTGTSNLFEALLRNKSLKLVTILGTVEEYGHTISPFREDSQELPVSAYGLSKLTATKLALVFNKQFDLPVLVLRPSIAYGPNQGEEMFIPSLINALINNREFKMTGGMQLRDFIYIGDLIDALSRVMQFKKLEGQVINIASGRSIKLIDVALQITEMTNSREYLRIGEISYRKTEIMNYSVDISKAKAMLNWHPGTTLSEGLESTIISYRKNFFGEN